MKKVVMFLALILAANNLFAQSEDTELTVYNQNFALVKEKRFLEFSKGLNNIRFSDVAAMIEPTSVYFKSVTDPASCSILEQNYEYDLVSAGKLLQKYIDEKITLISNDGKSYEGGLMSFDGENIVINKGNSLSMITRKDNIKEISFPELPEGLITKPTLMWQIESNRPGKHLTEVSYLTKGISWYADYIAVIDKNDKNIDLSGWVTIDNKSGTAYKDAKLKLIAGDVHRAQEDKMMLDSRMYAAKELSFQEQFQEKSFFEYHMYTLARQATVKNNQIKQISLLSANAVPVQKLFIYDPVDYYGIYWYNYDNSNSFKNQKIRVKMEFSNSKQNNLGMPLPKGKIKVYKKDVDGTLQFIGEDAIDHTPKDEVLKLYLGEAFDVIGDRKKSNYRVNNDAHWAEESFEINLRNHKEEDIEVIVVEHLWRYSNWKIFNNSDDFTKKDAQTVEFKVKVPKNSEKKVLYSVKYTW